MLEHLKYLPGQDSDLLPLPIIHHRLLVRSSILLALPSFPREKGNKQLNLFLVPFNTLIAKHCHSLPSDLMISNKQNELYFMK